MCYETFAKLSFVTNMYFCLFSFYLAFTYMIFFFIIIADQQPMQDIRAVDILPLLQEKIAIVSGKFHLIKF